MASDPSEIIMVDGGNTGTVAVLRSHRKDDDMHIKTRRRLARLLQPYLVLGLCASAGLAGTALAQGLTGALIGTVKDGQEGAIGGALVRLTSPALIGGPMTLTTDKTGQLRFPALPPGEYVLDVAMLGFAPLHEERLRIGAGATLERTIILKLAGLAESVVVEGAGSRTDARDPGFGVRFGPEDLRATPTRRASMFDFIRAAEGISPTSPSSGTVTTVSAFGSGTNENQFLIDGTNFTCPCNGVARSEPGIEFIQEIHVQSVGSSAEFGNAQGAVINVVTRHGGERLLSDFSYYGQTSALTSQPVRRPLGSGETGYERVRYRDASANVGGPVIHERLWFFAGYQYLRDHDSQPGADPGYPRTYEQDKVFGKLTWRLSPGWQLVQSVHQEFLVNPDPPTAVAPFEATLRRSTSVPAITFGHLTHTGSANTVWDVRVARFAFAQDSLPSTGDRAIASRFDNVTGITRDAPPSFSQLRIARTTAKAMLSRYQPAFMGVDHEWKLGGEAEKGGHDSISIIPTGVRFIDRDRQPLQAVSSTPSHIGGEFITAAVFATDAIRIGDRLTINLGVRYDHTRAISPDLTAVDLQGDETGATMAGLGTMYTWNIVSPRAGIVARLTADGRTLMRGSYGRFSQGVLTGELEPFHPGASPVTTAAFEPGSGDYTRILQIVDNRNLQFDPHTRAPRTDEYSVGIDRELAGHVSVTTAYVRKEGANFIGWTDRGGEYRQETRTLTDGRIVPVYALASAPGSRQYLLTNPPGYSLAYNGLVMALAKRPSHGWQASGSYTLSKAYGLQSSSGTSAAGPQVSTVSPPQPLTFGRDPNDLTNARGRLPNDRPHIVRVKGSFDVPRTGLVLAANFQYFSGKPWAVTALVPLPQNNSYRVLLEPRGTERLSSQSLLDLRVSRVFGKNRWSRFELLVDVLNALNETAEEEVATDYVFSPNLAQPTRFVDPRRAMIGVRLNLGR
jgi:hypothetical protein